MWDPLQRAEKLLQLHPGKNKLEWNYPCAGEVVNVKCFNLPTWDMQENYTFAKAHAVHDIHLADLPHPNSYRDIYAAITQPYDDTMVSHTYTFDMNEFQLFDTAWRNCNDQYDVHGCDKTSHKGPRLLSTGRNKAHTSCNPMPTVFLKLIPLLNQDGNKVPLTAQLVITKTSTWEVHEQKHTAMVFRPPMPLKYMADKARAYPLDDDHNMPFQLEGDVFRMQNHYLGRRSWRGSDRQLKDVPWAQRQYDMPNALNAAVEWTVTNMER